MRWIAYFNLILIATIIGVGAYFLSAPKPVALSVAATEKPSSELPKSPFSPSEEAYEKIGMELKWVEPKMQLPDLREEIVCHGKSERPDLKKSFYRLSLRGVVGEEASSFPVEEPIYLIYESRYRSSGAASHGSYSFSPQNAPTPLWIVLKQKGIAPLRVEVGMLDERKQLVTTPEEWNHFHLLGTQQTTRPSIGWELEAERGNYRVDSTLLVRLRARWVGKDCFLELHGGEEFAYTKGKERIDFQDIEGHYSRFVALGDFMIWKEGRWHLPDEDETTAGLPLLVVKKINQKILSVELWHPQGLGKTVLSLIHAREIGEGLDLANEFKFVGAKTWAQFIVESRDQERFTLKPNDWLMKTDEGWKTLDTPEAIDAYVSRETVGPLFILDKMEKQSGRQVLLGHMFNPARTTVTPVELSSAPADTSLANFYRTIPEAPTTNPKNARGEP